MKSENSTVTEEVTPQQIFTMNFYKSESHQQFLPQRKRASVHKKVKVINENLHLEQITQHKLHE